MLKDYFDSSLPVKDQQNVYEALEKIPRHCVFTSYAKARAYRAANCVKRENGRYDDVIFLYDSFYYIASKEFFHRFKLLIATLAYDVAMEKEFGCSRKEYRISDIDRLYEL